MKTIFRLTAILNLLLVVSAYVCVVIGAINKTIDLLVLGAGFILVSILPTAMMLALCNNFKESK